MVEELKAAIAELVDFVEANEPGLIAYNVYLSNDGAEMTVVHVHADAASLEHHMEVAGPLFSRFVDLVALRSISIYGNPSQALMERLHDKARLLGRGTVVAQKVYAGFDRLGDSYAPR